MGAGNKTWVLFLCSPLPSLLFLKTVQVFKVNIFNEMVLLLMFSTTWCLPFLVIFKDRTIITTSKYLIISVQCPIFTGLENAKGLYKQLQTPPTPLLSHRFPRLSSTSLPRSIPQSGRQTPREIPFSYFLPRYSPGQISHSFSLDNGTTLLVSFPLSPWSSHLKPTHKETWTCWAEYLVFAALPYNRPHPILTTTKCSSLTAVFTYRSQNTNIKRHWSADLRRHNTWWTFSIKRIFLISCGWLESSRILFNCRSRNVFMTTFCQRTEHLFKDSFTYTPKGLILMLALSNPLSRR